MKINDIESLFKIFLSGAPEGSILVPIANFADDNTIYAAKRDLSSDTHMTSTLSGGRGGGWIYAIMLSQTLICH